MNKLHIRPIENFSRHVTKNCSHKSNRAAFICFNTTTTTTTTTCRTTCHTLCRLSSSACSSSWRSRHCRFPAFIPKRLRKKCNYLPTDSLKAVAERAARSARAGVPLDGCSYELQHNRRFMQLVGRTADEYCSSSSKTNHWATICAHFTMKPDDHPTQHELCLAGRGFNSWRLDIMP